MQNALISLAPGPRREFLTTAEVAEMFSLAEITLRKWRIAGVGPVFIKCGGNVRYRAADIESWAASRTVNSTSQAL